MTYQIDCQNIKQINADLIRTRAAIVAIGDSFTAGEELGPNGSVDVNLSYINVLCKKYLNQQFTPINFGQPASGNTAAVTRLFLHNVNWNLCDKLYVIFCPSSMHRFDVISDQTDFTVGTEFKTMWGFMCSHLNHTKSPWRDMHTGFGHSVLSTRWEVIHTITLFQTLKLWCDSKNADLIVFPAFYNNVYSRNYFKQTLHQNIERDPHSHHIINQKQLPLTDNYDYLLDTVPWDKIISIDNSNTFFDLCCKQESDYDSKKDMSYYVRQGTISKDGWIMPRGHPSSKGHDFFASKLAELIKS